MDEQILLIRLAQESRRWDRMVDRVEEYLKCNLEKNNEKRDAAFDRQKKHSSSEIKNASPEDFEEQKDADKTIDAYGVQHKKNFEQIQLQNKKKRNIKKEKLLTKFRKYYFATYGYIDSLTNPINDHGCYRIDEPDFTDMEMELFVEAFKKEIEQIRNSMKTLNLIEVKQYGPNFTNREPIMK
jgi:hypothetical protein